MPRNNWSSATFRAVSENEKSCQAEPDLRHWSLPERQYRFSSIGTQELSSVEFDEANILGRHTPKRFYRLLGGELMKANDNEVKALAGLVSQQVVEATQKGASIFSIYENLRRSVAMSPSLSTQSNKSSIAGLSDGVMLCIFDMGLCEISPPTTERMLRYYESRDIPRKPILPQEMLRADQVPHFFLESTLTFIENMRFDPSWREAARQLKNHVRVDWPIPSTPFDDDNPYG